MEIWDAYDKNFNKIEDYTIVRGEVIPDGMYHLVCDILVRHTDGTYLLMQRDHNKTHGGMWEASAGGSAILGETPLECAKRELKEETGVSGGNITQVGVSVCEQTHTIYFAFLCITDCDKDSITFQEGETIAYRWINLEEFKGLKSDVLLTTKIQKFIPELNQN